MALPDIIDRITREEYDRMVRAGAFIGQRVELVEGIVYEMSPQDNPHASGLRRARRALERICPEGYSVDVQMPLCLLQDSEPEPDLAMVRRDPLDYAEGHPTSAALLVEIAHSSIHHDRRKAKTYAAAGIEEYWISDVVRGVLEVYREPVDESYRTRQVLRRGERIAPLVRPDKEIAVDDLLPPKL